MICVTCISSQGVVNEGLDSDGWVVVQWASGSRNKYRYRQGAHDVQLLRSGMRAALAAAAAAGDHSGEWRDKSSTRFHCSIPGNVEGALCSHEGGILQVASPFFSRVFAFDYLTDESLVVLRWLAA